MASKLIGVLNVISQTVTVTGGTPAAGPTVVSLDDGAYFAADRGTAYTTNAATSTVMVVDAHRFVVGESITVWRPSTDNVVFIGTVASTSGPTNIVLAFADTWLTGDIIFATGDLIGYIQSRVRSTDDPSFDDYVISTSGGVVAMTAGGAEVVTLDLTSDLQTWLRYSAASVVITNGVPDIVPDQQMEGYLYLVKCAQRDDLTRESFASQSRGVTGVVETLSRAQLQDRAIRVRVTGPPRSSQKTSYQAAVDFWDSHLAVGKHWRYHVDADNDGQLVTFDNPAGYETMVSPPDNFRAIRLQGGNDNTLDQNIVAHEYVAE